MSTAKQESSSRMILVLGGIALLCGMLIVLADELSRPFVEANRRHAIETLARQVVPASTVTITPYVLAGDRLVADTSPDIKGQRLLAAYDAGGELVGKGLSGDLGFAIEVLPPEQASACAGRDVGQQRVGGRAVFAFAVAEDHVGELVQDELLAVQGGVAGCVEHDIFGLADQPDGAESVAGIEFGEFNDAKSALTSGLDRVDEIVAGEGAAELEVRDGRRYGLFDIHGSPLSVGSRDRYRHRVARHLSVLGHVAHFLVQELGDGVECFRRDVAEGARCVGLHLRGTHGPNQVELRRDLLGSGSTVLAEQERGVHVEELREPFEDGGVLDVAVAVDHVRPARPRQVGASFLEVAGDLRVGRLRAGLGDGDIHQEPQTFGEVFGRSLALVFGHDGDPLPFATGKASM